MQIQWYPGHMTKTRRMIQENLKFVDVVVEIADARLPLSSRNPEILSIIGKKPKITLLNKADLADPRANQLWVDWYKAKGEQAILTDCVTGKGLHDLPQHAKLLLKEKIDRDVAKGIVGRAVKIMVVGIPNVGKSTLVNKMAGKASAKTGDRPGVTRGKQWVRLSNGLDLLDMPGILWPKFEDVEVGKRLAFTGAIKDEIMDVEELASWLLEYLKAHYQEKLTTRYKLEEVNDWTGYDILTEIGKKRGAILPGGVIDTFRMANMLLDEYRGGKIGQITLEFPR
ncbi:MAG: ribosome biogenesis GTPase YlqF [Hyphomonadaceae bacterium]|nr:ribosome biogenesis GTPase YlqF [Clostridia bacterium]